MNETARRADMLLTQLTATLAVNRLLERHTRLEAGPARYDAIGHHLGSVRSRIHEAIGSCARLESLGDLAETDDPWHPSPRHLTVIDSLRRLGDRLDRLVERFRALTPPHEGRGAADPLHKLDLALAECAGSMVHRFEDPGVRHDLQADLESDLCNFGRLMDERARLDPGRGQDSSDTLVEYRDVLERVARHIVEAEGDPHLQRFWRGVERDYLAEADRLSVSISEELIPLSIIDF